MINCVLALLLSLIAWPVIAGPVTLTVNAVTEKEQTVKGTKSYRRSSGIPEHVVSDSRQLEITLSNSTTKEFLNLTVVCYLFAKDVHEKDVVLAKKGQQTVSVHSLGKETFTTESSVMTAHSLHAKTVAGRTETTPASGAKFYGYGVQVLAGKEILAEVFDPPDAKSSLSKPQDKQK